MASQIKSLFIRKYLPLSLILFVSALLFTNADTLVILDCSKYQVCPKVDAVMGENNQILGYIGSKSSNPVVDETGDHPHTSGSIENAVDPSIEVAGAIDPDVLVRSHQ